MRPLSVLLVWTLLFLLSVSSPSVRASSPSEEEEDFYAILGLHDTREDASERDIKAAWRQLSKRLHPDHAGESQREAYQRIQRAYEVLGDRRKRRVYDLLGADGLRRYASDSAGGAQAVFSGERGRGETFLVRVSLADVFAGATHTVRVGRTNICRACRGTGARAASDVEVCAACGGRGQLRRTLQLAPGFVQQVAQPCGRCGGGGRTVRHVCGVCGGGGAVRGAAELRVEVERGAPDGHTILLEMEGDQRPRQIPGDVRLTLFAAPDPIWTRAGDDLHAELRLKLREALVGFARELAHVGGHAVPIRRRGGRPTQEGERERVRGEGMPKHHVPSERGDAWVTFRIEMPRELTTKQREAVERMWPVK